MSDLPNYLKAFNINELNNITKLELIDKKYGDKIESLNSFLINRNKYQITTSIINPNSTHYKILINTKYRTY